MEVELSIIVPAYNEERNIPAIAERFASALKGIDAELIMVDNGSADGTGREIGKLIADGRHRFLKTVRVEKNIGYGNGILQGLGTAGGEFLCWTHADLQTDPADVVRAYNEAKRQENPQAVFVKGKRTQKRHASEEAVTAIMGVFSSICLRQKFIDMNAQPKLFHRSFLPALKNAPLDFSLDLYAYYKAKKRGMKVVEVQVGFGERMHGESKWSANPISRIRTIIATVAYIARLGLRDIAGMEK